MAPGSESNTGRRTGSRPARRAILSLRSIFFQLDHPLSRREDGRQASIFL
ncbi:hypothetical protein HMPREF3038_00711 [Akkermansia sp. KLE1797]|nr:hypothetical protein HMPREF3038_00711 [Akkermansia sp. KLE1797]KZA04736.1 hypothetical protein HMPREF1326_01611 [Akkermansia sp. KLE1605]